MSGDVNTKARVTAKQRRELKKQAQGGTEAGDNEQTDKAPATAAGAGKPDEESSKHPTLPKHVRGKKGKKKKMQDKYAEQVSGVPGKGRACGLSFVN